MCPPGMRLASGLVSGSISSAGGIGVEIKTAGSSVDVRKQLQRYGTTYKLSALLLLTTCPSHLRRIPEHGYGVPTAAIGLSASPAFALTAFRAASTLSLAWPGYTRPMAFACPCARN